MSTQQAASLTIRPLIPDGVYTIRQDGNLLTSDPDGCYVSTQTEQTSGSAQKWNIKYNTASRTYTITNVQYKTSVNRKDGQKDSVFAKDAETKWQVVSDHDGQNDKFMIGLWDADIPEWLDNENSSVTLRSRDPATRRDKQRWTLDLKELSATQPSVDPKPTSDSVHDSFSRLKSGGYYSLINVQTGDDLIVWTKDPKVSMWTNPDRSKPSAQWKLNFSSGGNVQITSSQNSRTPRFLSSSGLSTTATECQLKSCDGQDETFM
ncbi:uncharacterized protein STEHIDRAFT_163662 [Stereum hirsutum FP-91666 SS1]|uniref:Uncharacterized protein n=1 Tax=Stereum hirsutum (strain FP-91666) TaxID=721885 RepID=R7RXC4_STEHR|nr:uncharacterized protein STEHIDRAFT_163662 [Stereum hirsutum FP-91666 SS1]EIM79473.1 hypothetical protein STEHIDRAFT_163662 [Stereum hirsutum FP-91666 SS1]